MAKLLYLQASPRDRSKSTRVAKAFLESYQQANPDDQIQRLDLFEANIPKFDGFAVQAKYALMHGEDYSPQQRQAWDSVEKLIAEFKAPDKYLLSVPMWNFSIPYRLKQYLDNIVQPGYTFTIGENGYEGLVKDKPLAVVYARGGTYPTGGPAEAFDLQKKYVELIFGFMGFEKIQSVVIEPTLQGSPDEIEKAVQASIEKAQTLAKGF